jgi:hypothetical protein
MREFTTAAKSAEQTGELGTEVTMVIDGREVTFLPATEGQIALMLSADILPFQQKISTAINFFFNVLKDGRDVDHFKGRMFDRSDPFGAIEIADIVEGLVEEWTANPTSSPSDSTPSQVSTGGSSTVRPHHVESTPSAFGLTGSAT